MVLSVTRCAASYDVLAVQRGIVLPRPFEPVAVANVVRVLLVKLGGWDRLEKLAAEERDALVDREPRAFEEQSVLHASVVL